MSRTEQCPICQCKADLSLNLSASATCGIVGKLLKLAEPLFSHIQNGNNDTYLTGLYGPH